MKLAKYLLTALLVGCSFFAAASTTDPVATGRLGVVVERASGSLLIIDRIARQTLARIEGLGDLSHAHVTFSSDERFAYVFGRDGGLTKVDLLQQRIDRRVIQAGNSIGGSISSDGRWIVAQNYEPGGIRVFDANTLDPVADVPSTTANGLRSKVVGLADLPGNRMAFALFEAGEIWTADLSNAKQPQVTKYPNIGRQPYDGLASQDGRYFVAGLYGEDGLALLDTWHPEQGVRKILPGYGRGEEKLPVYKMPHLRGWSIAGGTAFLPAIGRHEILMADTGTWTESGRIAVAGQPVFVMARPDGRQVWVNFAFPDNDTVQVINVPTRTIIKTLKPGKAILHMEFSGRGEEVWLSARDDDRIMAYNTQTLEAVASLPAHQPSGIFFTWRAHRIGM